MARPANASVATPIKFRAALLRVIGGRESVQGCQAVVVAGYDPGPD
jgi:hypothetical protein